ncbi:30S ribosomal protein THX [Mangrovivirga sp. M17]|uniref:30S ribosomal protein THX n=1 Tax=Mangrovivirga halotolerans TaxID=2993936 RepID=A0ABT3RWZ4_9BACT|nr:30S ribosomal protein THX [Mangrovivirga halotolerans]MCX2745732.1 30S ribosomal protein THX [Mangrovivirga halotolerans]
MGKGDKKTKKGKIWSGSYGVNRPRKQKNAETKKEVRASAQKK